MTGVQTCALPIYLLAGMAETAVISVFPVPKEKILGNFPIRIIVRAKMYMNAAQLKRCMTQATNESEATTTNEVQKFKFLSEETRNTNNLGIFPLLLGYLFEKTVVTFV